MHYYLQYGYTIRVAELHVCSEQGRGKKCPTGNPDCTRSPSKTLLISTSFPLADFDVIPRCANVLRTMVTIISPAGLSGNPHRRFHCQKHVPGPSLSLARHKGPRSIFVNYNPQYKSNNFPMYILFINFDKERCYQKQNLI
jgi:hypothetical protein